MSHTSLERRPISRKKQTKSYFNPNNGNLYSEVSRVHRLGESVTLKEVIEMCDTDVLYTMPTPKGRYIHPDSAYPQKRDIEQLDIPIVKWYMRADKYGKVRTGSSGKLQVSGRELDILPMGRWFDVTPDVALQDVVIAMRELERILNEKFPARDRDGKPSLVELLETPTRTGKDLLRRKIPYKATYSPLPDSVSEKLMHNFSQGRTELFTHGVTIEDLHCIDGRLMYGSCYRGLPVGTPIHDNDSVFMGYMPSFYLVDFTVPSNWKHIGLLPVKPTGKGGSIYPNMPRYEGESWCSYKELMLAIGHGWYYEIRERIMFPDSINKSFTGKDPLRNWGDTLVLDLREKYTHPSKAVQNLVKSALRHLLIDTIGGLHSGNMWENVYAETDDEIMEYGTLPLWDGTNFYGKVKRELTDYELQTFQPHWSLDIWCKARVKLAEVALTIPFEQIITFRTDSIWTNGVQPHIIDNGKVGSFREKDVLVYKGPFKEPTNEKEVRAMMRKAKGL